MYYSLLSNLTFTVGNVTVTNSPGATVIVGSIVGNQVYPGAAFAVASGRAIALDERGFPGM